MKNDFEDFLMDKHGEQYIGTDDCMIDDFEKWLEDLGIDDWLKYGDEFKRKEYKNSIGKKLITKNKIIAAGNRIGKSIFGVLECARRTNG